MVTYTKTRTNGLRRCVEKKKNRKKPFIIITRPSSPPPRGGSARRAERGRRRQLRPVPRGDNALSTVTVSTAALHGRKKKTTFPIRGLLFGFRSSAVYGLCPYAIIISAYEMSEKKKNYKK